ncbi:molybdopterin adenylyltransferase [bacterium]|nr:molybdopterin adenylyltransferase [bacterium]MBU1615989.1 molybdopterin adenylyltransferase [bacterium]
MIKVGILTVSDKGFRGEREDRSAKAVEEAISSLSPQETIYKIVPDEKEEISRQIIRLADEEGCRLVLTTGGTGLAPRDVTPEATKGVIDKEVPGLAEIMRRESFKITPHAALSRAVAGIRGKSLVVNLPGSPKAVKECLGVILPALPHALELIKGEVEECGRFKQISIKQK